MNNDEAKMVDAATKPVQIAREFNCDACGGKKFASKQSLERHKKCQSHEQLDKIQHEAKRQKLVNALEMSEL
jgi:hypothetical protein